MKDLIKIEENNSKKDQERVLISKIWYFYFCDGKVT